MRILPALCLWACLSGGALAQNLGADDAAAVQLAMQKEGFLVTQDEAADGTPILKSRVSDSTFRVYFYGCENAPGCSSIQFSAGYDLDAPMSALQMNAWNTENRYARAIIDDEGDPFLRMDVSGNQDREKRGDVSRIKRNFNQNTKPRFPGA